MNKLLVASMFAACAISHAPAAASVCANGDSANMARIGEPAVSRTSELRIVPAGQWAVEVTCDGRSETLDVAPPEICIARISTRVKRGGHFIPAADVRRRYARSKKNFISLYAPIVDYWTLLYNGDSQVVMEARRDNGSGKNHRIEPGEITEWNRAKSLNCRMV